ncbi:MAG: DNA polymerase II, partial [Lentisphaerae bacterium]|nr:DNA polymerase II [Lentisphaerota bacterium]
MKDALIFGQDNTERIVAVEAGDEVNGSFQIDMFVRDSAGISVVKKDFQPYVYLSDNRSTELTDIKPVQMTELDGTDKFRWRASFKSWTDLQEFRKQLAKQQPDASSSVFWINDPVVLFMLETGITLFKGMAFDDLRRVQIDIETDTEPGYDFCNPSRKGDIILAIGIGDSHGTYTALSSHKDGEKALLKQFVEIIRELDPDVIEGHNIFGFDLPYIEKRASMHRVKLDLGRNNTKMTGRNSRFSVAERTTSFKRFSIPGRHIVDTYFMAQMFDVSSRDIESFSLKSLAKHFGVTPENRVYIEGSKIAESFKTDPEKALRYLEDDIKETRALSDIFSPVY